jgi:hypothetical protein
MICKQLADFDLTSVLFYERDVYLLVKILSYEYSLSIIFSYNINKIFTSIKSDNRVILNKIWKQNDYFYEKINEYLSKSLAFVILLNLYHWKNRKINIQFYSLLIIDYFVVGKNQVMNNYAPVIFSHQ